MTEKPTQAELIALARIRVSNCSDWAIQLAYLVADEKWDAAAQVCVQQQQALNILAGLIAQLLPVVPTLKCEKVGKNTD